MFKLNLQHECSLNSNPFEVCNIPRLANAGQGEKCVCSELLGLLQLSGSNPDCH